MSDLAPYGLDIYGAPALSPADQAAAASAAEQKKFIDSASSDWKLMAWKRAQGASDAVARAESARTIGSARTAQGNLAGEYADMLSSGLRKISDQFENTGMWSSSNRLRAQNEEQGALEGQMLGQRNAYADEIGGANISLAKQLAQSRMDLVEQTNAAGDRVAGDAASNGVNIFATPPKPGRLGGYR